MVEAIAAATGLDAMLSARALGKRFGGLHAVSDVSIDVHAGEIHAVIGPNGAGKSTLINLLSGELTPTAGTIRLAGADIAALAPERRARAGLGRSYQKTTIFPDFTAAENVRLAAQAAGPHPLRLRGRAEADPRAAALTTEALQRSGLAARGAVRARDLSHGEQRQLEIAMVLATAPRVILLDEPLAGMGQSEARRIVELIATLKQGRAVLIVEHDMDAVFELADRLTVMADGRVIAAGAPADVRRHPAVRAAYLGEDAS
jgi:branched-chain amino acid transport system ATP-binding protein